MKPTIIQLEYYDNVASIKEKINNSPTQRVLLVWPDFEQLNLNQLDYLMILRHAYLLDVQLAFVLDDPGVSNMLREYGLSIFRNIPEAQKKPWRKPKIIQFINKNENDDKKVFIKKFTEDSRRSQYKMNPFLQWPVFFIGIAAFFSLIVFIFPSATIFITPKSEVRTMTIPVIAEPTVQQVNLAGFVPVKIEEVVVEGIKEGTSNGSTRIPDQFATGEVIFRNLSDKRITIPVGTVVRTENDPVIRFETIENATLPQRFDSEVRVNVRSLIGGTAGNIPALEITVIEDDFGANLVVSNPEQISGGTDIKTFSPTENDFEVMKRELLEDLRMQAINKLIDSYGAGFYIPEKSVELKEILVEQRIPEVGDPGERFTLDISASFSTWLLDKNDLTMLSNLVLDTRTEPGLKPIAGSIVYSVEETSMELSQEEFKFELTTEQQYYSIIDGYRITQLIAGRPTQEAINILENEIKLENTPKIEIIPSFWDRLPFLPFRIYLEVSDK